MAVINLSLNNADKTLLLNIGENNIRFVTAKSLTKTAQNIQEAVKSTSQKLLSLGESQEDLSNL